MDHAYSVKTVVFGGVVLVAVGFFVGRSTKNDIAQESATPVAEAQSSLLPVLGRSATPPPLATAAPARRTVTVRLTQRGPVPKTATIRMGDSISFLNDTDSDGAYWPASDPHPTHTLCPGFDARRGLQRGESYTLLFLTPKTCTYHNHLDPANSMEQGAVIVQ